MNLMFGAIQLKPNMIPETVRGWVPGMLTLGYRILIAAVIVMIGIRVAHIVRAMLKKTFTRMEMDVSLSRFLLSLINVGIYALVLFMALERIGIPSASIVAVIGSAGVAVALSLQGSLANFAGGILILMMRPFRVQDYIVSAGAEGTVQNIGLVYTTLVTVDNRTITVPNGSLSNAIITNVTAQEKRRVDVEIGISYSSDMKKAKEILHQVYAEHPQVLETDDITVYVGELADSAVLIGGRGWTKTEDYWTVRWAILETVKERFDAAGIEIPFKQMDVNIRNVAAEGENDA
ncbi:MAG: mechanosensitive ion channel [Lachnospiraceae bacterium]|nr:mechanosensitive ion channel [Lachnospiraceae bacterium]